jgi:4-hydroxy-2-oxoheptanedioate aldolase
MGATFLCHMADILLVKQGLDTIQEQFAPLGFKFSNHINGKPQCCREDQ